MLYDLLQIDLAGWHPREVPADEGLLRDQKRRSLEALDQWLELTLQDGILPGNGIFAGPRSRSLVDIRADVKKRVSIHDERFLNDVQLSSYLNERGIHKHRTVGANLWRFPPLPQLRTDWERRFKG
jgi:hypothetical protein